MAKQTFDYRGMKCPQPIIKAIATVQALPKGTTVDVISDCPEFPTEMRNWCQRTGRVLINLVEYADRAVATIQS